jgi:hypothetical protein
VLNESSKPPIAILPIVFTSLTREEVAPHLGTAASYKIALACKENILDLFGRLDNLPSHEELYKAALALIPSG